MEVSYKIICKGRVQGVFFRATTKTEADKLGVTGWVRNLPNGDVEILATASEEKQRELIKWCHSGPQFANVTGVEYEKVETEAFKSFEVRYY